MKNYLSHYFIISLIVLLGIAIDMLTKHLSMWGDSTIIDGVLSFVFTWNTGAGWSILADQTLFLTIFSALLSIAIVFVIIFYRPNSKLFSVGIALVLAGAVGNLIDRIFFGAVRDFICFDFINFPIFNIADVMLTFGAIILAIWMIFVWGKEKKNAK